MSRLARTAAILEAAEKWKQQCLLDGGSLFGEERLWTRELFEELKTHFVEHPEKGSRSFEEKLHDQLADTSPQAKRLWAEITWAYLLIVASVKGVTKVDRIRRVWEWSGVALPEDHWALGDVLHEGFVTPGQAYHRHQWREFAFIVTLMLAWTAMSRAERVSLLSDSWRFSNWVDGQMGRQRRQFRHALLFLLCPDDFEPTMATNHKKKMVKAFREETGTNLDVERLGLGDLDKAVRDIRQGLEGEHPGREVDFYDREFRRIWLDGPVTPDDIDHPDGTDDETWCRERFGTSDVWVIAPGEGARLWSEFLELGIAAIGWDDLGDLCEYESRDAIHGALIENGHGDNPIMASLATWEFAHEMKKGDIVLAKRGRSVLLGWGRVTGDYSYDSDRAEFQNVRTVKWSPCVTPLTLSAPITTKTLTRFTAYKDWLREVFESIDDGEAGPGNGPEIPAAEPYDFATALDGLFLEDRQFRQILDSISLRKNLILQGPPGVGKTFIARRVAWCLMGHKDHECVEMVQFHQSYAYEDFVQGWRPTEHGGFTLRNGVFFEFCERAKQQPDKKFVFIIDEINRGNLSRIFGELLMLIEADKRGPEHAIALTYGSSDERFSVPDNVHLLGLMNTADRSLAIVDYALRRRFAFEALKPAYGNGKFREFLLEADVEPNLVDRIDRNLGTLNERIRHDKDLGPGFEIGHSYFVPEESADEQWYRATVETQIVPLLREYWFDLPDQVNELVEILRQ